MTTFAWHGYCDSWGNMLHDFWSQIAIAALLQAWRGCDEYNWQEHFLNGQILLYLP